MGRPRIYENAAERQKAHRRRQAATETAIVALPTRTPRQRPPSRPARLSALIDAAQELLDEYRDWLDRLPEAFEGTPTHERLMEAVERLETALEALEGIDPPLGFGRD